MNVKLDWANLSNQTLEDRREGKRVTLQFGLEICGTDFAGNPFTVQGRTRNVSHHGCCFEVARTITRGEKLSLKVVRHNRAGKIESTEALLFRIAWVVQEDDLWVAGAQMISPTAPWGVHFPEKTHATKL